VERETLESVIRSRPFGEVSLVVSPAMALDTTLRDLKDRLPMDYEVRDGADAWRMAAGFSLGGMAIGAAGAFLLAKRRNGARSRKGS
jgi:hypothetical protein